VLVGTWLGLSYIDRPFADAAEPARRGHAKELERKVRALAPALDAPNDKRRELATSRLKALGVKALPVVERVQKETENTELKRRLGEIMKQWRESLTGGSQGRPSPEALNKRPNVNGKVLQNVHVCGVDADGDAWLRIKTVHTPGDLPPTGPSMYRMTPEGQLKNSPKTSRQRPTRRCTRCRAAECCWASGRPAVIASRMGRSPA